MFYLEAHDKLTVCNIARHLSVIVNYAIMCLTNFAKLKIMVVSALKLLDERLDEMKLNLL